MSRFQRMAFRPGVCLALLLPLCAIDIWATQVVPSTPGSSGTRVAPTRRADPEARRVRRTIETICRGFARAVVRRDVPEVRRVFPDADSAYWAALFDQHYIVSDWPVSDVRVESGTRASCAFSIDVVDRRTRARPFTQTDYQSFGEEAGAVISSRIIRYTLQLEAQGSMWVISGVTGS